MRNERRPVILSYHAADRMRTRGISPAEVEHLVRTGAWRSDGIDAWVAFGLWNRRRIEVAFVEVDDQSALLVKTVYIED